MEKTIKERLSEKIDIAVKLGVKFQMSLNQPIDDIIVVNPNCNDKEFEKKLDSIIKNSDNRLFMSILREKKLINE